MVTEKVVKSKKPQKYAKNGRFFTPEGRFLPQEADFCKIQRNGPMRLLLLTQKSYTLNFIKIRHLDLP